MRLHEYQTKQVFNRYGIPIPRGRIASIANDVKQIAEELGGRVVIKAQVLVSGRGKVGGIRLAKTPQEAEDLATSILGMNIKGLPVYKVLVDETIGLVREVYLGITNDRTARKPVMIASSEGGVDLEAATRPNPEKIIKIPMDPQVGLREFQARDLAGEIDLPKELWRPFIEITRSLWRIYKDYDATLVEINPLVITSEHRLMALDGKMTVDDNAIFRHLDLLEIRDTGGESPQEIEASKYGLAYIKMEGQIGCLVNGAGLALAVMDEIKMLGGEPANFLDIGGGAIAENVRVAFRIVLSDPNVKSVLVNIFGGITRCDEVAKGIRDVLDEVKPTVPITVRVVGTNSQAARQILADADVLTADTLFDATEKAVAAQKAETLVKGG